MIMDYYVYISALQADLRYFFLAPTDIYQEGMATTANKKNSLMFLKKVKEFLK